MNMSTVSYDHHHQFTPTSLLPTGCTTHVIHVSYNRSRCQSPVRHSL